MINKENYTLTGTYTKIARKLKPYSRAASLNLFRVFSDLYSQALAQENYSFKELAILALNFTNGRDFYSGKQLMTEKKILISQIKIHRDHLFPASKCGLFAYGNVVITTDECNIEKSDMDPYEYYKFRFNKGLPTLYPTLDEAYQAINYLHSLYRQELPFPADVLDNFNEIDFPMTWNEVFPYLTKLFKDNRNMKFISPNTNNKLEFSPNLKDIDFWNELNNPDNIIYKGLNKDKRNKLLGRIMVHLSELFVDKEVSAKDITKDELNKLMEYEKNNYNSSDFSYLKQAGRALLRYQGVLNGDIDKNNNDLTSSYPEIIWKGLRFSANLKDIDLWKELNNPDNIIYKGLTKNQKDKIIGRMMVHLSELFVDKEVSAKNITENELNKLMEYGKDNYNSSDFSYLKQAERALLRYQGVLNGDIDEHNNILRNLYPEIIFKRLQFSTNLRDIDFWQELNNPNNIIYKGLTKRQKDQIIGRMIINLSGFFIKKDLSIKDMNKNELSKLIKLTKNSFSRTDFIIAKRVERAILRYKGVLKGDIDKNNNILNNSYPEIMFKGLQFPSNLKDINFWRELNNPNNIIYKGLTKKQKDKIIGRMIVHLSELFIKKGLSAKNITENELNKLMEYGKDNYNSSDFANFKRAGRTLLRYQGVLNGDIDKNNNDSTNSYPEIIYNGLTFSSKLKDIDFWRSLNNPHNSIYKKYSLRTIKNLVGAPFIHLSSIFADEQLSVLELTKDEVVNVIEKYITLNGFKKPTAYRYHAAGNRILDLKAIWPTN